MNFMTRPMGQRRGQVPTEGWGPCSKSCRDGGFGLVPFRKDRVFIKWTRTANVGLFLAADQSVTAFAKGVDQEDTGGNWPAGVQKSEADTTLYDDGAIIDNDNDCWEIWGMGLRLNRPVVLVNRQQAPLGQSATSPEWLDAYQAEVAQLTYDWLGVKYRHGQKKCDLFLGGIADWPTNSGATGGREIVTNGANAATGVWMGFSEPDYTSGADSSTKLRVDIFNGNLQLGVDEKDVASAADVHVPVDVYVYGEPVAKKCANGVVCMPLGMTQAQVDTVLQGGLTAIELEIIAKLRQQQNGG